MSQPLIARPTAGAIEAESAAVLLESHFEQPRYIFNSMLPAAEFAMIAGKKYAGKTTLALQAALNVVSDTPLFGRTVRTAGPVLFLGYEETRSTLQQKLERLKGKTSRSAIDRLQLLHAFNDKGDQIIPRLDQGGLEILKAKLEDGYKCEPYA